MSRALHLDCASRESAEASLLQSFGCSVAALREFVADPTHGPYFEEHAEDLPFFFDRWLFEQACERLGQPALPGELCWFHGTRVPEGTTFSEGILPLGAWLPRLRTSVLKTLRDERAEREVRLAFERQGGFDMHFRSKVQNPLHWGPYAILVREVADAPRDVGQHDYLGMPEIIEDLCTDVKLASGLDLLPIFQEQWKPAVVKFVAAAGDSAPYALGIALCYLRECALKGRPGYGAVWCYDARNSPVSAERILNVEWVSPKTVQTKHL